MSCVAGPRTSSRQRDWYLRRLGRPAATGIALSTVLRALHGRVLDDEVARKNRRGIEEAIRDAAGRRGGRSRASNRRRPESRDTRRGRGCGRGRVRELVSRLARRSQLEEMVASCDRRIEAQIGKGPDADELRAELETGALSEWELRCQELTEQASDLHVQRDEAVRRHQDAKQETARIGESSDVARLETEAEGIPPAAIRGRRAVAKGYARPFAHSSDIVQVREGTPAKGGLKGLDAVQGGHVWSLPAPGRSRWHS